MNNVIHPTKKLGKQAPRHDTRTLKLNRYLTPAMPQAPIRAGYIDKVKDWPMYMNDTLGDCVIAGAGHMEQQWSTYAGSPVTLTDQDILKGYEAVGGYVPGDPSTDNGCDILTALKYWRKTGFGGRRIKAFVSVNPKNRPEVEQAIYLFGSVYIGLNLPLSAQVPDGSPPVWEVPPGGPNGDGSVGSWGGHCVPLVGYSANYSSTAHPAGTLAITWGTEYSVTWPFLKQYCDEMFAVLSADWFNAAGDSPTGLNLDQLLNDLTTVTGEG